MDADRLKEVWNQPLIPVVIRTNKKGDKLRVRLPFNKNNRAWLNTIGKSEPAWIIEKKHWELPKTWFNSFVNNALHKYKKLYVMQPYREQEKCARKCMEAQGHECNCSCMGANHGAGMSGSWFEVDETFATRWGNEDIACRLMVAK